MYMVKDAERDIQEGRSYRIDNGVIYSFISNIWRSKDITREEAIELERKFYTEAHKRRRNGR